MKILAFVFLLAAFTSSSLSAVLNDTLNNVTAGCTINSAADVRNVIAHCKTISVGSFVMPAGQTLNLALQAGTTLTFNGHLTFGYTEWNGPLIQISGNGINVIGGSNHLIDGQGAKWWDGHGGHDKKKKPSMMHIVSSTNAVFKNIKIKDCPEIGVSIFGCTGVTIQGWNIDNRDGDTRGAVNTDGFDIGKSSRVTIKDTIVWNQDDCICINGGENLFFDNMHCTGSHGLSIAVGIWSEASLNTVRNVTFQNSVMANGLLAIHVKTIAGKQTGEISDVTYKNIRVSGITRNVINVQQDYTNNGSTGHPQGNIKIRNLDISNVSGSVSGNFAQGVYVLCGQGGCSNFRWSGINISGAHRSNSCNFQPIEFRC